MARTKKADYVSNRPTGSRTITLELQEQDWETLVDCLGARRIYFEQRQGEARKFGDQRSVEHYGEMIEIIGDILRNVCRQIDACYYAKQIQVLKEEA